MRRVKPPHDFLSEEDFDVDLHNIADYFFPTERLESLMHYDEVLVKLFYEFIDEFKDKFAKDAYIDHIYDNFKNLVSNLSVQTQIMIESSSLEQLDKRRQFMESLKNQEESPTTADNVKQLSRKNNLWSDEFGQWAFGATWYAYNVYEADSFDLKDAWNKLHSDLCSLEKYEQLNLNKLVQLWEKHKNG